MNFITIKVARLNGTSKEVTLSPGSTVAQALQAAEMELNGEHLTVDGLDAQASTVLTDGQVVMLAVGAKGA